MEAIWIVLAALRDVVQVDPWLAAMWFLSAVALAGLIVYAWERLLRRHGRSPPPT